MDDLSTARHRARFDKAMGMSGMAMTRHQAVRKLTTVHPVPWVYHTSDEWNPEEADAPPEYGDIYDASTNVVASLIDKPMALCLIEIINGL
jgi:hypothetical protein